MKIRGAHDQNTEHRVQFCLFCIGPLVGGDGALPGEPLASPLGTVRVRELSHAGAGVRPLVPGDIALVGVPSEAVPWVPGKTLSQKNHPEGRRKERKERKRCRKEKKEKKKRRKEKKEKKKRTWRRLLAGVRAPVDGGCGLHDVRIVRHPLHQGECAVSRVVGLHTVG